MYESLQSRSRARGLRHAATPRLAAAASKFNGIYMRPNLQNDGSIPASGPFCTSPDIWISGTHPVDPVSLTTDSSYANISASDITIGQTNYIYVRGRNGTAGPLNRNVRLYFAPSALIPIPSRWKKNVISTDQGSEIANMTGVAANQIGVADHVFQWDNVPRPDTGNHFCLFAQLNDENNSNPFPDVQDQLDMAALISKNLGWGWRNTTDVPAALPDFNYTIDLSVPSNWPAGMYFVYVEAINYVGWKVAFQCSQVDAKGKQISLVETLIGQGDQIIGVPCTLNPGFSASVTVNAYGSGGKTPRSLRLHCSYQTNGLGEANRAIEMGLVDPRLQNRMRAAFGLGVTPTFFVTLGVQHFVTLG